MNPEIKSYITRSVTDIARKCQCKENEVISEMGSFVADWTINNFTPDMVKYER